MAQDMTLHEALNALSALQSSGASVDLTHVASLCWRMASLAASNREAVAKHGGVEALIQVLRGPFKDDFDVCRYTCQALSMALRDPEGQRRLAQTEGIIALLSVLRGHLKDSNNVVKFVVRALDEASTAEVHQKKLVQSGGVEDLVGVLRGSLKEVDEVALPAVQTLGTLTATQPDSQSRVIAANGINVLIALTTGILASDAKVVETVCWTIANLAGRGLTKEQLVGVLAVLSKLKVTPDTVCHVARTISMVSTSEANESVLVEVNAVDKLLRILSGPLINSREAVLAVLTTVARLVCFDSVHSQFASAGGISVILPFLRGDFKEVALTVAAICRILSEVLQDPLTPVRITGTNESIFLLVDALKGSVTVAPNVVPDICAAIAVLCSRADVCEAFVQRGVVENIVAVLQRAQPSERDLILASCSAVLVLSNNVGAQPRLEGACEPLLRHLTSSSSSGDSTATVGVAMAALHNLCKLEAIQPVLMEANAVRALCGLLPRTYDAQLEESIMGALSQLFAADTRNSLKQLQSAGGLQPLMRRLVAANSPGTIQYGCRVLDTLVADPDSHALLVSSGCLELLLQLLAGKHSTQSGVVTAVCWTILKLISYPDNEKALIAANGVETIARALEHGSASSPEAALYLLGVIYKLAADPTNMDSIVRAGIPKLALDVIRSSSVDGGELLRSAFVVLGYISSSVTGRKALASQHAERVLMNALGGPLKDHALTMTAVLWALANFVSDVEFAALLNNTDDLNHVMTFLRARVSQPADYVKDGARFLAGMAYALDGPRNLGTTKAVGWLCDTLSSEHQEHDVCVAWIVRALGAVARDPALKALVGAVSPSLINVATGALASDPEVIRNCCLAFGELASDPTSAAKLIDAGVVQCLLDVLTGPLQAHEATMNAASWALSSFAAYPASQSRLFSSKGIQMLLETLRSGTPAVQSSLWTLSLIANQMSSPVAFAGTDIESVCVFLLGKWKDDQVVVLSVLRLLSNLLVAPDTTAAFVAANGLETLNAVFKRWHDVPEVVRLTSNVVANLAFDSEQSIAVAQSVIPDALAGIVGGDWKEHPRVQEAALSAFSNLFSHEDAIDQVPPSVYVPSLLKRVKVLTPAACAVSSAQLILQLSTSPGGQEAILSMGGLETLIECLQDGSAFTTESETDVVIFCTAALANIANLDSKASIVASAGALQAAVSAISKPTNSRVRVAAARLLGKLAWNPKTAAQLAASDFRGIDVLLEATFAKTPAVLVQEACWALGNLATHSRLIVALTRASTLERMIGLLRSDWSTAHTVCANACRVIAHLTVDTVAQIAFAKAEGMDALREVLQHAGASVPIIQQVCAILSNLSQSSGMASLLAESGVVDVLEAVLSGPLKDDANVARLVRATHAKLSNARSKDGSNARALLRSPGAVTPGAPSTPVTPVQDIEKPRATSPSFMQKVVAVAKGDAEVKTLLK